jgi:putative SOS response-associated peptidase YedK
MCGRFVQYSDPEIYASHFDALTLFDLPPRYNVAPTQQVLVVRTADERREFVPLRWGLIPPWSKGPESGYRTINARAETVDVKPAYRNSFRHRRCLIQTEGFYEWKKTGGAKTPFLIRRKNGEPFGMAGLWETWRGKEGDETIESCTIIVTEANALVRELHDRMPVILAPEDYAVWLDPENANTDALRKMLRPAEPSAWMLRKVSRKVNSPKNDGPERIEPVAA